MIRINLLPVKAVQKRERFIGQMIVVCLAVSIVTGGCLFYYFMQEGDIKAVNQEITEKKREINALQKKIGEVKQFKKLKEELLGKLEVLEKLKKGRSGPVHLLDQLSSVIPDKVWINSFNETGGKIKIEGVGLDEEKVARFMKQLQESDYYQKVELLSTQQAQQGGLKLQKFSIQCQVQEPPSTGGN